MDFLKRYFVYLFPFAFFIVSLFTIYDYGVNWDSPVHFARGQAYLRYILTRKTNYEGQPQYCLNSENLNSHVDFNTGEVCDRHRKVRVSEYESSLLDFNSWVAKGTYGHPAFSDVLLAVFNNVFFKALGWFEDIPAYHLYSVFTTSLLALTLSIWSRKTYGTFASAISVLSLYSFPLLFGEQHFNIKDPPMAALFTISLFFFWMAITEKKVRYLYISALAGGASFGTKFNFVFAPFILLPWVACYLIIAKDITQKLLSKKMFFGFALYPIIVFLVFFVTWPALWSSPVQKISDVVRYYHDIGGSKCGYLYFTKFWFTKCTQDISLKYLFYTLPPISLFLLGVGSIAALIKFKEKQSASILWLSFFYFTILRVTLSFTDIYGGLRQIMEFVGPMALLCGLGALFFRDLLTKILARILLLRRFGRQHLAWAISLMIIIGYIPIFLTMKQLHPNENVYFNSIIGGLKGAAEKDFPGYGNTYGNAYLQGVNWLNQHAEPNSSLALVSGNAQNISRASLREDIDFSNGSRSGYNQEGEYSMGLVVGQDPFSETFRYKYLDIYLEPVYEIKIDNVPILKIWKNSKEHLKSGVSISKQTREQIKVDYIDKKWGNEVVVRLGAKKNLKAISFTFPNAECKEKMVGAKIYISTDGDQYIQTAEGINSFSEEEIKGYNADFVYLFPGDEAQYLKVVSPQNYPCKLSMVKLNVFTFPQSLRQIVS